MKITRRVLAGLLSILTGVFAPGLVPYQAAAQVFAGATAGTSGAILRVPRIGAVPGAGLAPLSPAAGLAPSLTGGMSAPSWVVPSVAAIPTLPASALVRARSVADGTPHGAVDPARASVDAKILLALADDQLSAAADGEKMDVLDFFFTGARRIYGRLTGVYAVEKRLAFEIRGKAAVASALTPTASAASASDNRATPPRPITIEGRGLQPGEHFLVAAAPFVYLLGSVGEAQAASYGDGGLDFKSVIVPAISQTSQWGIPEYGALLLAGGALLGAGIWFLQTTLKKIHLRREILGRLRNPPQTGGFQESYARELLGRDQYGALFAAGQANPEQLRLLTVQALAHKQAPRLVFAGTAQNPGALLFASEETALKGYAQAAEKDKKARDLLLRVFGQDAKAETARRLALYREYSSLPQPSVLVETVSDEGLPADPKRQIALLVLAEKREPAALPLVLKTLKEEEPSQAYPLALQGMLAEAARQIIDKLPVDGSEDWEKATWQAVRDLASSAGPQFNAFVALDRYEAYQQVRRRMREIPVKMWADQRAALTDLLDVYQRLKRIEDSLKPQLALMKETVLDLPTGAVGKVTLLAEERAKDMAALENEVSATTIDNLRRRKLEILGRLESLSPAPRDRIHELLGEADRHLENGIGELRLALDKLGSATGWGVADVFLGGSLGLATAAAKYHNRSQASSASRSAQREFEDAKRKLAEVKRLAAEEDPSVPSVEIGSGNLSTFFDVVFDGPLTDIISLFSIDGDKDTVRGGLDKALRALSQVREVSQARWRTLLLRLEARLLQEGILRASDLD